MVGLTGGIGSGKSTVARMFGELGVPVVDADQVAREVVEPGTPGLAAVVEAFGEGVLDADGRLDRARLAERVFGDDAARHRLEAILHPRIAARSFEKLGALAREGHAYAIYEAALLVENGSYRMMGALVVVAASEAAQRARVAARDGLDEVAVGARIAAQLPLADKVRVADYVVDNSGTPEQTRERVEAVHRELLARFGARS
ncbi:MAG: dephospho-CoA kinase [Sandaracinaceae bacterium]|nr:dephospho-CoA kinase [Sandaracinaceae bacterium]